MEDTYFGFNHEGTCNPSRDEHWWYGELFEGASCSCGLMKFRNGKKPVNRFEYERLMLLNSQKDGESDNRAS